MSETPNENDEANFEQSEVLDQLQPSDTLDYHGVDDVLDEGIVSREKWSPGQGYGTTHLEEAMGETLEQRMAQEEPEQSDEDWDEDSDDQVGDRRSGRLIAPDEGAHEDEESAAVAYDVGIDGAGASAEEAAVHVIPDDED